MDSYQDLNAKAIDKWCSEGWEWGVPISHGTFEKAKRGEWDVVLTPTKSVPHEWFGDLRGKDVLGLASGGGQQMPVFAALGAKCTCLDYSSAQLESERIVAEREGYDITLVRADMTRPLPFPDESFDLIFHPVSNCYVEEVRPIWRECFRILRKGGVLLAGLDNGINYVVDYPAEEKIIRGLPFNSRLENSGSEEDGWQFSHSFSEQIGGQLEAGFVLTRVDEDTNGSGRLHELGIPTFWMTRAVKP